MLGLRSGNFHNYCWKVNSCVGERGSFRVVAFFNQLSHNQIYIFPLSTNTSTNLHKTLIQYTLPIALFADVTVAEDYSLEKPAHSKAEECCQPSVEQNASA